MSSPVSDTTPQTLGSSHAIPKEASSSTDQNQDRLSTSSTEPNRAFTSQHSAPSETHFSPLNQTAAGTAQPPHNRQSENRSRESQPNETTVTVRLPSDSRDDGGPGRTRAASFHTAAKPEDVRRLLGIPAFQPRDQQSPYTGQRNYNYEERYPPDEPFKENDPDARFFKVYLDEAEIFDQEKIRSHRDNLDSLLVFAALFSAIVTTFVVQTSQALQPDQSLITNYLLLYQIEILKVVGNNTAVSALAPPQYLPDTTTRSLSDVWVNGLFFTSLALSISTALLSVLAKQWLQAYDSSTSGSARDRALIRHLRFMGLTKWKMDEIIGALPLVLHASVVLFLIGLTVLLWAVHQPLAFIVIVISGISVMLYLVSVIMPAVDIECPYRIPLLYRPMRYLVHFISGCYRASRLVVNWLCASSVQKLPGNIRTSLRRSSTITMDFIQTFGYKFLQLLQSIISLGAPPLPLTDVERSTVQDNGKLPRYLHHSISWLHDMSSNTSVQRVAAQAIAGNLCQDWNTDSLSDFPSFGLVCSPRIISTIREGLFEGADVPSFDANVLWSHPSPWLRTMNKLAPRYSPPKHAPSLSHILASDIVKAARMGRTNHIRYILGCTYVNVDLNLSQPSGYSWPDETPLQAASFHGNTSTVRLLLDQGAKVNIINNNHGTALQAACRNGHLEVVKLLLENGADMNIAAGWISGPALHAASAGGHLEVVKILLENGADATKEVNPRVPLFHVLCSKGNTEVIKLLIEKGVDVNLEGEHYGSGLQAASERGHLDLVKLLLNEGADVNLGGGTHGSALQAASFTGQVEVVKLLLENKADVNHAGGKVGSALRIAIDQGYPEIAELLRRHGAVE